MPPSKTGWPSLNVVICPLFFPPLAGLRTISTLVLSRAHHRVVIEHEVAIGVVVRCFEREGGFLVFGSVCTFDRMYLGDKLCQVGASSSLF
jgi:small neutral amino acid transporter SnatA (MarC family)